MSETFRGLLIIDNVTVLGAELDREKNYPDTIERPSSGGTTVILLEKLLEMKRLRIGSTTMLI
jgi:hypothetical protein